MDTAQWPQEIVVKPIEDIVVTNTCPKPATLSVERKPRPQKEQALNCPRCHSTNTKFCYYNNYSLTQPRYFCKTCRRYWTEGGSLRNIPVGGGSRKNRRSSSSASASICSSPPPHPKKLPADLVTSPSSLSQSQTNCAQQNPKIHHHEGQDLNLAFPANARDFRNISEFVQPNNNSSSSSSSMSASVASSITTATTSTSTTTTPSTSHHLSALELLTGITSISRGLNSFMAMPVAADPNTVYSTTYGGFPLQDFKPTPNFSLDHHGIGSGYNSLQSVQETSGRLLFPFQDSKQVSSTTTTSMEQKNKEQQGDSTGGYWTGMLGGGSW